MVYSIIFFVAGVLWLVWWGRTGKIGAALFSALIFTWFVMSGLHYFSNWLTGDGVNEAVMFHLNADLQGAGFTQFLDLIVISALYFVLCCVLAIVVYRYCCNPAAPIRSPAVITPVWVFVIASFWMNPAVVDVYRLYTYSTDSASDTTPGSYRLVEKWSGQPRKNVVLLYLESLEETFFNEQVFPGLTPELTRLREQALHFTDIRQVYGSEWTIAGMTASQCGIPLVTAGGGNSMTGIDQFLPRAVCLGDLLADARYELHYMGGADLRFAGKGAFYHTHGFSSVEGLDELLHELDDSSYQSGWGLYDDTLFALAEKRFTELSTGENPFGLVLLTLDTHHPNGHVSRRCEQVEYRAGTNPILNAVHCADQMAAEFIEFVMSHDAFADTTLVVMSDHLAMRNTASRRLNSIPRRNLVMMFDRDLVPGRIDTTGSLLDVTPTLLPLLGGETDGIGFGRNLIVGNSLFAEFSDVNNYLMEHRRFLSGFWSWPSLEEGLLLTGDNRMQLGEREIAYPALLELDHRLSLGQVRFADGENPLHQFVSQFEYDQNFVWVDSCREIKAFFPDAVTGALAEHCVVAGRPGSSDLLTYDLNADMELSRSDLRSHFSRRNASASVYQDRLAAYQRYRYVGPALYEAEERQSDILPDSVVIVSSGHGAGQSYVATEIGDHLELARGLTLVGITSTGDAVKLSHADTCAWEVVDEMGISTGFQHDYEQYEARYARFALVAHDSLVCDSDQVSSMVEGMNLELVANVGFREPYVAIISVDGQVEEFTGDSEQSIIVVRVL